MRPARVRQMAACGKAAGGIYAAPSQWRCFCRVPATRFPGGINLSPYTHLINENARRISTAGIVHAINY